MANVLFKRGSQSALNALINQASGNNPQPVFSDGCFYLTTDTDRLYVAQSATELVELNKSIGTVSSVSALRAIPKGEVEVGQFMYVMPGATDTENIQLGNILAVCVSKDANGNPEWKQVNPDTDHNDNDHVHGFSVTSTTSATAITYTYTFDLVDKDGNPVDVNGKHSDESGYAGPLTGTFVINRDDIRSIVGTSVGTTISAPSNNKVTISTTGQGANTNQKFEINAGDNILFSGTADNFTIGAVDTQYMFRAVSATDNAVELVDTAVGDPHGRIKLNAADTDITVSSTLSGLEDENVQFNIGHKAYGAFTTNTSTTAVVLSTQTPLTVVTGATATNGHLTSITTREILIPTSEAVAVSSVSASSNGKIKIQNSIGDTLAESGVDLYYKIDSTTYTNQSELPVYTKTQVDAKLRGLDSMTYCGTVGDVTGATVTTLPTTGVHNGDTYKVVKDGTYSSQAAEVGDLFIATGTESTDTSNTATYGTITSGLTWTYIPSGGDADTQYNLSVTSNTVKLSEAVSGDSAGEVTFNGGTHINVSTSGSAISVVHTGATAVNTSTTPNSALAYSGTFNAISGIVSDDTGHITGYTTTTYTLPDSDNTTYSLGIDGSNSTQINLTDQNGDPDGKIRFIDGDKTSVAVSTTSTDVITVKVNHGQLTNAQKQTPSSTTATVDLDDGFVAVDSITRDDYGHVTGYTLKQYHLPDSTNLSLVGAVSSPTANTSLVNMSLLDATGNPHNGSGTAIPSFKVTTNSLKISTTAATTAAPAVINVDIEWGTFGS